MASERMKALMGGVESALNAQKAPQTVQVEQEKEIVKTKIKVETEETIDANKVVKSGWIKKKTPKQSSVMENAGKISADGFGLFFQKRFFVLHPDCLKYYDDEESSLKEDHYNYVCGIIPLQLIAKTERQGEKRFNITLQGNHRIFALQTDTEEDSKSWMSAIKKQIGKGVTIDLDSIKKFKKDKKFWKDNIKHIEKARKQIVVKSVEEVETETEVEKEPEFKWSELKEKVTLRMYYLNNKTGQKVYKKPDDFDGPAYRPPAAEAHDPDETPEPVKKPLGAKKPIGGVAMFGKGMSFINKNVLSKKKVDDMSARDDKDEDSDVEFTALKIDVPDKAPTENVDSDGE